MLQNNLNYIFYKEYYRGILNGKFEEKIKACNRIILNAKVSNCNRYSLNKQLYNTAIDLYVAYPGLLVGTGYIHTIGQKIDQIVDKNNHEIKAGFSLDYVSGLPYIPSASVKGTLKQAFHGKKSIYVKQFLKMDDSKIKELKIKIFGDSEENGFGKGEDIFFDAQILEGNFDKLILGKDNITAHKSIVQNPKTINILKILPGVKLRFYFYLTDTILDDGTVVSVKEKQKLFKNILIDFGIGAKTNTGYGRLLESDPEKDKRTTQTEENRCDSTQFFMWPKHRPTGNIYKSIVKKVQKNEIKVFVEINDSSKYYPIIKKQQILKDGNTFRCEIFKIFKEGDIVFITFISHDNKYNRAKLEFNNQTQDIQKKMLYQD